METDERRSRSTAAGLPFGFGHGSVAASVGISVSIATGMAATTPEKSLTGDSTSCDFPRC